MPNSPADGTVTVSFTLPADLDEAVVGLARANLTNKSDIIRRALIQYLPEDLRAKVLANTIRIDRGEVAQNRKTGRKKKP
jgi:predicted transcriptional regulator